MINFQELDMVQRRAVDNFITYQHQSGKFLIWVIEKVYCDRIVIQIGNKKYDILLSEWA